MTKPWIRVGVTQQLLLEECDKCQIAWEESDTKETLWENLNKVDPQKFLLPNIQQDENSSKSEAPKETMEHAIDKEISRAEVMNMFQQILERLDTAKE